MPDILPRLAGIVKIIVASDAEIPVCCQACRFSDDNYFLEWYCAATGKKLDFPRAKPDWCPIVTVESLQLKVERIEEVN